MPKTAVIRARTEPNLKEEVETIFHKIGLNASEAVNLFYSAVKRAQGIPFELKIPNKDTIQAMHELESGGGKKFNNKEEFFDDLGI